MTTRRDATCPPTEGVARLSHRPAALAAAALLALLGAACPSEASMSAQEAGSGSGAQPAGRLLGVQRDEATLAADRATFAQLEQVPIGGHVALAADGHRDEETWRDVGFLRQGNLDLYRREVDLLSPQAGMVATDVAALSEVDCIAIISIDRHNGQRPYIYSTLASIFAAFPAGVQVNVLVGNSDDAYLSPARLGPEIGERNLGDVHVFPTSEAVASYLRAQLPANRRGGWNYTRALRGYRGSKGLILMEDDVEWGRDGPAAFSRWLSQRQRPAISLYNARPNEVHALVGRDLDELAGQPGLAIIDQTLVDPHGKRHHWFACLQGMYYAAEISAPLGRYVQLRMHHWVYDNIIGEFFADHRLTIGYAFPSMVQHIGRTSSCESYEFTSARWFRGHY